MGVRGDAGLIKDYEVTTSGIGMQISLHGGIAIRTSIDRQIECARQIEVLA